MKARAQQKIPKLGRRERNKLQTMQGIRSAARELFSKHGYDNATLREIAGRAHVALGTLFNYAEDKRDLVFLIVNEELEEVTGQAIEAAQSKHTLIDQLMAIFRVHYDYFAQDPVLSRILLRELVFYSSGKQAEAFHKIRQQLTAGIEKLIESAQRSRRIRSGAPAAVIARHIFFTFSAAVRWWIARPRPHPRTGLKDLRRLFDLQIRGLEVQRGR